MYEVSEWFNHVMPHRRSFSDDRVTRISFHPDRLRRCCNLTTSSSHGSWKMASQALSRARRHLLRNLGYRRRCAYAEFREIFAALQASTTLGFWRSAARNDSRHGNALCSDFDERLDIMTVLRSLERNHGHSRRKRHFQRTSWGMNAG